MIRIKYTIIWKDKKYTEPTRYDWTNIVYFVLATFKVYDVKYTERGGLDI